MYYKALYQYRLILLMQFINIKNPRIFIYLVFSLIFLVGIAVYEDYGLTLDDEYYRKNGEFYYEYIKILFSNKSLYSLKDLELLSHKMLGDNSIINHPALFEILLAGFVDLFNIDSSKEIYNFSHLLNFLIFFLSLIFFYKLIFRKFNSVVYGLFSILILFFTPRIFAETFYNSRDIFFLSLFIFNICAGYNFLLNQNFKTSILFSLTSALLINAKVLGAVPPVLFLFFFWLNTLSKDNIKKKNVKFILIIVPATLSFIYIFWPYIWTNPLDNLINAYKDIIFIQNSTTLLNFYMGEFISSTNVPWHYRIVWFLITVPIFILFFFVIGFCLLVIEIVKGIIELNESNDDLWKNSDQMFSFVLLTILVTIVVAVIKFNASQFGGWRHLYFLYPLVIILSLIGFDRINKLLKNSKLKFIVYLLIGINLFYIISWNYRNHPHQQVYFNYFIKDYAKMNFELDYWGLSNIHSIKYILQDNINYPIKIGTVSFSSLEESILMLDENNKKNISIVYNLDDADFLIDNYMKRIRKNFIIDKKKYVKYFEIVVNEVPINTVYKKIY